MLITIHNYTILNKFFYIEQQQQRNEERERKTKIKVKIQRLDLVFFSFK